MSLGAIFANVFNQLLFKVSIIYTGRERCMINGLLISSDPQIGPQRVQETGWICVYVCVCFKCVTLPATNIDAENQ